MHEINPVIIILTQKYASSCLHSQGARAKAYLFLPHQESNPSHQHNMVTEQRTDISQKIYMFVGLVQICVTQEKKTPPKFMLPLVINDLSLTWIMFNQRESKCPLPIVISTHVHHIDLTSTVVRAYIAGLLAAIVYIYICSMTITDRQDFSVY